MAQKTTGRKGLLAQDVLTPDQMGLLGSIKSDLNRQAIADTAGKSLGSNTVQNLASQNLLSETANGIGLPGLANIGVLGRVGNLMNKTYGLFGIPDELKQKLSTVLLNPNSAES